MACLLQPQCPDPGLGRGGRARVRPPGPQITPGNQGSWGALRAQVRTILSPKGAVLPCMSAWA